MSTSDPPPPEFESWIAEVVAARGTFTALVVLVEIGGTTVTPLVSTWVNVIGGDVEWSEMIVLFAGAGVRWDGAAFFAEPPMDNPTARIHLKALEARIDADRLVLNEAQFFDAFGRRLRVDEVRH